MAKYTDSQLRDIYNGRIPAPTAYAKRIANNMFSKGVSRSRAGGKFTKVEKAQRPMRAGFKAPPIKMSDRIKQMGSTTRVKRANAKTASKDLKNLAGAYQKGKIKARVNSRVWINVFDPSTGKFVAIYKGGRNTPHGISVSELHNRIRDRMEDSDMSYEDAFIDVLVEDSENGDYPENGDTAPANFTQVELHFL